MGHLLFPGKVLNVADHEMKLSKHGHIICPWKVFLMLILDVEFMLPNFDFWIQRMISKWEAHPGLIQIDPGCPRSLKKKHKKPK